MLRSCELWTPAIRLVYPIDMTNVDDNASALPPPLRLADRPSLVVFFNVVYAIVMREVRTRFGTSNLGYFRALLEPALFIVGFVAIWHVLDRASPIAVPVELFFLCSLFPYGAFMRTWDYASGAIRANTGLLMFPIVRPLDFFVARTVLEAASQLLVFLILAVIVQGLFGEPRHLPDNLLGVLGAAMAAILLGASLGLVFGCVAMEFPSVEVAMQLIRRALFFSSGVFFTADSLPVVLSNYLYWNPVLHVTEWFRSAYFSEAKSYFLDLEYLWGSIVLLLVLGLALERRLYRKGY
jgi:capsular polysaccharide transport system permease protein